MDECLTVTGVSRTFTSRRGRVEAVRNVSLTLSRGESLGIIGPSGCGKTTLLRMIAGLLRPEQGSVQVRGRLGFVAQDPYASLDPTMPVFRLIAEPLRFTGRARRWRDCREAVERAMDLVRLDFSRYQDRLPGALSGGERQRVSIARAMVLEPELLLLDEPTSMLDEAVRREIVELIAHIARQERCAFLMVTHDIAISASVCQNLAVMEEGRIIEEGPAERVLHHPERELTRRLVLAATDLDAYWAAEEQR